ncbi:MAG TPA: 16S rRNA (guanine(966)-N(2))-methyltransferase RsmD [Candidatus Pygmaiobacter gallistercoris]|nr:16S rRNA (guanine(966)-N(2))-methyltransferase RsmD [Candidatus Pygmaiobacter gallistercoris]
MRVIAGTARGTRLSTLPGTDVTRPTVDRVKEGMFSALQFILPGARVLDLFAGSGQLGIEALSRGAAHCVFVDENRGAIQIVRRNLAAAGVADRAEVLQTGAQGYLASTSAQFDILLLDPPYRHDTLAQLLPALARVTAPGGVILCESEREAVLPEQVAGLRRKKQYRYGTVLVSRYEKDELEGEPEL